MDLWRPAIGLTRQHTDSHGDGRLSAGEGPEGAREELKIDGWWTGVEVDSEIGRPREIKSGQAASERPEN